MNNDLISRSELRKRFQAILDRGDMFCEYDIIGMVDNAPTVDFEKLGESLRCQIRAEYGSCDDCELSCPRNELIKLLDSERPTGHWINEHSIDIGYKTAECSECGNRSRLISHDTGFGYKYEYYPFCHWCGADMRGESNELR